MQSSNTGNTPSTLNSQLDHTMTSSTRRDSVVSHHSTSQTSQTARECVTHHHDPKTSPNSPAYRFIESQLQLEADAREALPYVKSTVPIHHTLRRLMKTVLRLLHVRPRTTPAEPLRVSHLQSSRDGQICRRVLLVLDRLPWRTHASRALQQAGFCL